jgi:hypothetical protein
MENCTSVAHGIQAAGLGLSQSVPGYAIGARLVANQPWT